MKCSRAVAMISFVFSLVFFTSLDAVLIRNKYHKQYLYVMDYGVSVGLTRKEKEATHFLFTPDGAIKTMDDRFLVGTYEIIDGGCVPVAVVHKTPVDGQQAWLYNPSSGMLLFLPYAIYLDSKELDSDCFLRLSDYGGVDLGKKPKEAPAYLGPNDFWSYGSSLEFRRLYEWELVE